MGAKTGLLVYADGDVGGILRAVPAPRRGASPTTPPAR